VFERVFERLGRLHLALPAINRARSFVMATRPRADLDHRFRLLLLIRNDEWTEAISLTLSGDQSLHKPERR
jgi:hypothetical protein